MPAADFLVVGAGIAGASVAYRLSRRARVILLERESQPGYHTTGRSAAFFVPSYGGPAVRPLTLASAGFMHRPPEGFTEFDLLVHRPALYVARADQMAALRGFHKRLHALDDSVAWLEAEDVAARAAMLRPGYAMAGVWEPECHDIDVGTLHQAFLRGVRQQGGRLVTNAGVTGARRAGGLWTVTAGGETYEAPVIINAAGAWGDELARLAGVRPVGLTPLRRTIITFDGPQGADVAAWPLVLDIGHQFYFKPESGRLLASPSDETPAPACDVQPEAEDIARLVDRLERATTLTVPRLNSKWAGLRTFAPDRAPVAGFDDDAEGFFWLVGQGGFGIQTSPALSELAAALALGEAVPQALARHGVSARTYGVARLR